MFDSSDSAAELNRFSGLLFGLQLFAVPFLCLLFGILTYAFFEELLQIRTPNGIAELVLGYLVFSAVGFLFGYTTQTAIPRVIWSGGRWVWIPPASILVWGIWLQLRRSDTMAVFFDVLLLALLTGPTIASCLYSIGVVVANRPATTVAGAALRKASLRSPITKLARLS
jgi:hypothetical protein